MTKLDCSVKKCVYNEDDSCRLGKINVRGHEAKKSDETECASFSERACDCAKSDVGCACKDTDVHCDAVTCTFNESCKCGADHIGIANNCAPGCCETECASFKL
ncbi:DUF1540 domain-containing protein [Agathobacter sp.]